MAECIDRAVKQYFEAIIENLQGNLAEADLIIANLNSSLQKEKDTCSDLRHELDSQKIPLTKREIIIDYLKKTKMKVKDMKTLAISLFPSDESLIKKYKKGTYTVGENGTLTNLLLEYYLKKPPELLINQLQSAREEGVDPNDSNESEDFDNPENREDLDCSDDPDNEDNDCPDDADDADNVEDLSFDDPDDCDYSVV